MAAFGVLRSTNLRVPRGLAWVPAVAAGALLASTHAYADAGCAVRVGPNTADSSWVHAARDLERQLGATPDGGRCAAIEVLVRNGAAYLTLDTRDGRRAVRELSEPFELAPSVQALLVTIEPGPPASEPSPKAPVAEAPAKIEPPATEPAPELRAGAIFGGALGARVGGGFGTPTVAAFGAVQSGRWEFGAAAQWEPSYRRAGEDNPAWRATGLGAGILLGRRDPIAPSIDLLLGIVVSGAVLRQGHRQVRDGEVRMDGRLGGYVGAVWPSRSSFRMRATLGADVVAIGGSQAAPPPDVPRLPSWAATLAIGVEGGGR